MSTDLTLARLAKAVYEAPDECARQAAELGYNLLGPLISQADADCGLFRAKSGSPAVLAFRGTQAGKWWEHPRDMVNNFGFLRPWSGSGRVHGGYWAQHVRIRDRAQTAWEAIPGAIPLIVTGHSLGGSLAHLFGAWACGPGRGQIARLVTFGAPRAATREAWRPFTSTRVSTRVSTRTKNCSKNNDVHSTGVSTNVDVRVYQVAGDFAPAWPYYAPFRLCQPAEPIRLKSPKWWYEPLRRHWIESYIKALEDQNGKYN